MAGLLQNEDFKTEAELVAAGGAKSQLLNDTKIYVTAKGINESLDDAITLGKIGGGGSGGINYITNFDFAADTTGWATYADSGAAPTDGTGGSPNITFARNTTTPLRGGADGKLSKDAANRQGQGLSYDFTVDLADATHPAKVSFSYRASANFSFANGDVSVWIYDRSSSTMIPVTPSQFDGSGKFVGEFQFNASTSTLYRLIIHIATTNANAWDLYIDDVKVGPSSEQAFVSLQDKQYDIGAYVTCTNFVSVVYARGIPYKTRDGVWRLRFNLSLITSAVSIGTVTIAGVTFSSLGRSVIDADGVTSGLYKTFCDTNPGSNNFQFQFSTNVSDPLFYGDVALDGMPSWAVDFYPVQLNDGADTRVLGCDVTLSALQNLAPNNSLVKVNLDTVVSRDTHGSWDLVNKRFNCKIAGWHAINAGIQLNGVNVLNSNYLPIITINGSMASFGNTTIQAPGTQINMPVNTTKYLNVGDYVELYLFGAGNNSSSQVQAANAAYGTFMQVHRVSGPAYATAGEKVAASYMTAAGNTITNSFAVIDFGTKMYDTHNAVSGTGVNWRYTCPCAGKYEVKCFLTLDTGAWTAGVYFDILLGLSGATPYYLAFDGIDANNTKYWTVHGSAVVNCVAGDTLYLLALQTQSASKTLMANGTVNYVMITKVA